MTRGHIEVLALAGQRTGFRENRVVTQNGIAPTTVERHELSQLTGLGETDVRRTRYQFRRSWFLGTFRQFEKKHVRCKRALRRGCKTVLRAVQVRLQNLSDLRHVPKAKLSDQGHCLNVGLLI